MTQLGIVSPGAPAGRPEKPLTTGTSSAWASRMALRNTSSASLATAGSGCSGLLWHAERAEDQAARVNGVQEGLAFALARQQLVDSAVLAAGIAARADLNGRHARGDRLVERFFKGEVVEIVQ